MKRITSTLTWVILLTFLISITSCNKKDESQELSPQGEMSADKEKELKDKEEFLNLKEQQLKEWEERLIKIDSSIAGTLRDTVKSQTTDSAKIKEQQTKFTEKEKELNKRLDNPKVAIGDYLEYIKRGISDPNTFESNMLKASQIWDNRSADSFKRNYKNVKKFVITSEPNIVSQKGNNASVRVKIKQSIAGSDGKETEKEVTVTYNLVADSNGKWKIKSNVIK